MASGNPAAAAPAQLAGRDIAGLLFVADMYGVQADQLAAVLGVGESRARATTGRAVGEQRYSTRA